MLLSSMLTVIIPLAIVFFIAQMSVFARVKVDIGFDHYAEKADPTSLLKMPANACINAGYTLVGLYWIIAIKRRERKLKEKAYLFYTFSWMAVFYGPIQFARIVTQTRLFGILDQWFTLPFFAWVVCWNEFIYRGYLWQTGRFLSVMRLSLLSYVFTFFHDLGFEVALGLHILAVLAYSCRTQARVGTMTSRRYFCLAVLFCAGFVFLKLADHSLTRFSMFLRYTGHFWSKVCDVVQIHFIAKFFWSLQHPISGKAKAK